ncbi:DUF5666 domain-containing protein [Photobacterium sp. DA100]|uniref:DUF5666 domain-containing protein n=1 Tax=Photobacterium sp. DA100 TaxID=3027472 RepID=UPI0024790936|nr:DUF5666 domain-containing protein [Photobacterium sp. DA100]WEM41124.1 DUF5666 domain-containing protein [Photobacterium sp. DA100]
MRSLNLLPLAIGLSLGVTGCGGDSSSSDGGSDIVQSSPLARTIGTVDSVSYPDESFTINQHQLDGSQATISYDDSSYSFDELKQGMQVEVEYQNSQAQQVYLQPAATGQVTAVSDSSLSINGLSYEYPGTGFNIGDWVMLYGLVEPDDSWKVTVVTVVDPQTTAEIEGAISGLDPSQSVFTIATVQVDYSNAVIEDSRTLADGLWVEVYGQFNGSQFVASLIDIRDNDDVRNTELEGIITWVSPDLTSFDIGGNVRVHTNGNTSFDDGTRSNLEIGAIVEVDLIELENKLFATRVDFQDQVSVSDNLEFNVEGEASYDGVTLSINGIVFIVDVNTEYDDGISLSNVNGQWVELDGKANNGNYVKRVRPERKDNEISLEGLVENGIMWGYSATDNSLEQFNGQWVDIECQRAPDNSLSFCRLDPSR